MLLAIAILSTIGYVISFVGKLFKEKIGVNLLLASILVISTWSCLPIAIITIVVTAIILILGIFFNEE